MQSDDESSALLGGVRESKEQPKRQVKGGGGRKTKEAKRRRFVMKQVKAISKPQQLESVSETEEGTLLLSRPSEPETTPRRQEFFGVRSYVHTFYEAMAMEDTGNRFKAIRKRRNCWRATFWAGVLVLSVGLTAVLVGNLVPKRNEVVDVQEDIEIINRSYQVFNQYLDVCKIAGIVLFCVGGILLTIVLLALTFARKQRIEEEIALAEPGTGLGPGPFKVPVTEELRAVQPKRSEPEVAVSSVCEVP